MADAAQILRSLGETKGCRTAVLTTYNVSFRFLEQVVLPRLRGVGCQHVLLLVDAARLSEAANDPENRPQLAGKLYSVVPVSAPGAFHPKLLLMLGEKSGRVWVGSHNLTMAGFNHNREVTTAGTMRSEAWVRAVAQRAWLAVRSWLPDGPVGEQAAGAVERLAPWITHAPEPSADGLDLLFSTADTPLWPQLRARMPAQADRVTIVGPFFDDRLAFLEAVARDLTPKEIVVGLMPNQASFPAARRHEAPASVRVVHALSLLPDGPPPYLHAKALLVESGTEAILVTGSANPSSPAFLGGDRANFEAVIVQVLPKGSDPLGLGHLRDAAPLGEDDWAQLPARIELELSRAAVSVLLGVAERGEIHLATPLAHVTGVRFLGEADADLGTTTYGGTLIRVAPPDTVALESVRWLEALRSGETVARVLVHHPRALRRLSRTGAEQKLTDVLHSLETNQPALVELFALLDPLLDAPITPRSVAARSVDRKKPEAHFGSGGAEAAADDGPTEELYGTEGNLAEVMLFLHHRLGVAVDRVDRSEEDLVGTDDEALVATTVIPPDADARDRARSRFDRVTKKLRKVLTLGPSELAATNAHSRMSKLAAVLGVANATVQRTPPQPWQRLDHLRLASTASLRNLLVDGVAAALSRRDLVNARSKVGERAEELRITPVLLAWLCCELRIHPPGPPRRTRFGAEKDLIDRAVWIALFPTLDEDQWKRLLDKVISSDSSTEARDWYDAAKTSAEHLRSVVARPQAYLSGRERAEPGDLVLFGRDTLRVLQSDIGGPRQTRRVQWLEPGDPNASREVERGVLLLPSAWGGEA